MKTSIVPNFKGKRLLKISLRSIHLVGFAGVFASVLTDTSQLFYWWLLITSGVGLFILEALSNLVWFVQIRGLALYLKLFMLGCAFYYPEYALYLFIAIILLSGLISHAPSSVRYFSFLHFKKVTSLDDTKG